MFVALDDLIGKKVSYKKTMRATDHGKPSMWIAVAKGTVIKIDEDSYDALVEHEDDSRHWVDIGKLTLNENL